MGNAIAYYVANDQLRGGKQDPLAQSQVLQWLNFADADILPAACTWVFPCLGIMQFNKGATERAKEDIKKAMTALNEHLLHQTFLVGERVTLADIVVACTMLSLYQNVLDPNFRKPFGNVNRWFTTVVNQPQVKKVVGAVALAEKMAQFDAKKFAETQKASVPAVTLARRKRRRPINLNLNPKRRRKKPHLLLPKKKIHSPLFPRAISTWTISNDSILTTMKTNLFPTFGRSSTRNIILFGVVTTSTMTN